MRFVSIAGFGLLATEALALPRPETSTIQKRSTRLQAKRYHASPSLNARDGSSGNHFNGGGWLLTATVGPTNVTLNIDTGSSDLWVASYLMPADQQSEVQTGHDLYDPISSSSAHQLDGENYNLSYADGSGSSGPEYTDAVQIGDVTIDSFAIGVCSNLILSPGQSSRDTDGPVGLAFEYGNSARPTQQPTFAEALMNSGQLSAPMFATHFKSDDSGSILFGAGDSSLHTGDLVEVGIDNSTGAWNVPQTSVQSSQPIGMIADTGTPTMSLPGDALQNYFSGVPGSGQDSSGAWYYPCSATLPDLQLYFPTANPNGPGTVYVPGSALVNEGNQSGGNCYTWLAATDGSGSLGVPFFTSMYVEFDMSQPALRFAAAT